ncbi:MAG: hypothetical protein EXS16_10615 [Gemmataceae bacterium]|nr:hypothetical protein [Gemmataceae bacterium]
MRHVALLFLIAWPPTAGTAQTASDEPPVADRPVDFSNLVGVWTMRVEASPTDAHVEEPITLRIILAGIGPAKYEPHRKHLKLFPESFEADFYIQELRDEHRIERNSNTWVFVYRLKPKHDKVKEIDGITLWYYNPKSPGKRKYVPIFAPSISLTVKAKREAPSDIEIRALDLPETYYVVPPASAVIGHSAPFAISAGDVALALTLPPILCGIFVLAWRRWFPSDAERAIRIRRWAAPKAVSLLQGGNDDPHEIAVQYLAERFDFVPRDPTPPEVFDFLKRRGFTLASCAAAERFFAARDAGRFAGMSSADRQPSLTLAVTLINALEADRCAQS